MGNRLSEEKVTRIINNAGGAVGSVKERYAAAYGEERPGTRQNHPRQPLNRHRVKPIRYCSRSRERSGGRSEPRSGATLAQPMLMDAPVNENTGALTKLVTLSALQAVLQAHANLGGTFVVATPSLIYSGCILRTVRDVTGSNDPLPQRQWLWDFEQPLITETGAKQAINSYLSKIDNGDKTTESARTNTVSALGNTSG